MLVEENYLERDTSLLGEGDVREEVIGLHRIARAVAGGEYQMALGLAEGFLAKTHESREVEREVKLLATMSYFRTGNTAKAQEWLGGLLGEAMLKGEGHMQSNLKARVLAYTASLFIEEVRPGIDPKVCIAKLVSTVKEQQTSNRNSSVLPMVLGMLTGCRNFKPVAELKHLDGPVSRNKAIKSEFVASWKFLLGKTEESIAFKK